LVDFIIQNRPCSVLDDEVGRFYWLTKLADFSVAHDRFLLANFIGRQNWPILWIVCHALCLGISFLWKTFSFVIFVFYKFVVDLQNLFFTFCRVNISKPTFLIHSQWSPVRDGSSIIFNGNKSSWFHFLSLAFALWDGLGYDTGRLALAMTLCPWPWSFGLGLECSGFLTSVTSYKYCSVSQKTCECTDSFSLWWDVCWSSCCRSSAESISERILKIGRYLADIWAGVQRHVFDLRCRRSASL